VTDSPLAMPVVDPALEQRLVERLARIEEMLADHCKGRAQFVSEAATHLMMAGGKRFRPLLVLLAAEAGPDPDAEAVETAACVVELTHVASLYHDDVMDEASLRRGATTANARWDNNVAILTGDFLFGRSSELTAELGPEAVLIQARTFTRLVEGQIMETVAPGPGEDPLAHYLDVVAGKTGSLIATSARYGAMFSGARSEVVEALSSYGEIVGSAFQLTDDILLSLLGRPLTDDAEHAEALELLRRHPAIDQARDHVLAEAARAKKLLEALDPGPVRTALESFADIVATRTS